MNAPTPTRLGYAACEDPACRGMGTPGIGIAMGVWGCKTHFAINSAIYERRQHEAWLAERAQEAT